jgi:cobaltochelatase CobN
MDLWASATLRTGGDDLAQALALIGVKPVWDHASNRVIGFEIIPEPLLERPRVDVTLRISGLFRDLFLAQINLFDQASQAVAELEEDEEMNPLAGERRRSGHCLHRIFGAAPQVYGLGLMQEVNADPSLSKQAVGELYLAASGYAYGLKNNEGLATQAFAERVARADAFIHVQDQAEQDLLGADAMVEHEGGFAAAANSLGNQPELYHVTTTDSASIKVRTLPEEAARVIRGRAGNPRWIAGQMQHGHRGAAEIAETIDNLFALAVLTEAVTNAQFECVFDAICGNEDVRDFLMRENPRAAAAIALRFEAALTRGLWQDQRNSTQNCLAEMQKAPR